MARDKEPPDAALARLIATIGKADAGDREHFENLFRALKREYRDRLPGFEAKVKCRELLRKYLANAAERRGLRRQLKPYRADLAKIRNTKLAATEFPDEDSRRFVAVLADPDILARAELGEERDVEYFLEQSDDYRKGPIRKLVIEPFLTVLLRDGIEPTRELPLTRMVEALLAYLGIDQKRCPSNLREIASDVRREFEKRPSQRPTD